jgi:hypothetical protein
MKEKLVGEVDGKITITPHNLERETGPAPRRRGDELTVVEAEEGLLVNCRGADTFSARRWPSHNEGGRR